ncbi:MAG: GHKL domain-containing protein [Faecalibacterium sp.]
MNTPLINALLRALLRWSATMTFCLPLRRRKFFWKRAILMLFPLAVVAWALDPLAQSNSLADRQKGLLLLYVSFFLLLGVMVYICVRTDWKAALYCAVWGLLTAQTAFEGWCLLENYVYVHGLDLNRFTITGIQLLFGTVFYALVYGTVACRMPDKDSYHIGPRQLGSAFFLGSLFMVQAALINNAELLHWPKSYMITVFLGQFYSLTLLYLQTELFKKGAMQKEMDVLNLVFERQRQQYQVARENINIINRHCHELKMQIACLRRMSPDAALERQIDEAEQAARQYDAARDTGNEVLNVVLTEKTLFCEEHQIQLNAVVDGRCLTGFDAGDLYALFANALEGAIKGVLRLQSKQSRVIELTVCVRQSFIVINVISPEYPYPEEVERILQYEQKVLKNVVKKYHGTLTMDVENGFCALRILLPQT